MAAATSFQRRIPSKLPKIRGTRPSVHNAQLLVSTGVPSLDHVLGGGIAVGTIVLIEEDTFGSYAKLLLKYYLTEGVMSGHSLFVGGLDVSPEALIEELPAPLVDKKSQNLDPVPEDDKMQIAWRYKNLPQVQSSATTSHFGHYYDLSKTIPEQFLKEINITYWNGPNGKESQSCEGSLSNKTYQDIFQKIQRAISEGKLGTGETSPAGKILRIGLHSVGSPLWRTESLVTFLMCLKALLRSAFAVGVITIPTHLFQDIAMVHRCEHMCDTVVRLEAFAGSDQATNPVFRDYHGLFHLKKLPVLNSLVGHIPATFDLAFKLRRKKFLIEKLHLPPELPETKGREQDEPVLPSRGCGSVSAKGKNIDF